MASHSNNGLLSLIVIIGDKKILYVICIWHILG